ncbi:hypothetical protein ACM66B_006904 [Microbotryomycetes sp. NB124-2]
MLSSPTTLWVIAWALVDYGALLASAGPVPNAKVARAPSLRPRTITAAQAQASPLPHHLVPTATLSRRNNAGVPSDATMLTRSATPTAGATGSDPALLAQSAASSTSSSAPSSSSTSVPGGGFGALFGGGIPASYLTWIAIVVIVLIGCSLLVARYYYIKRFYHPTLRSYFVPPRGLHVKWLGIHVRGPPARIPREPPPSYGFAEMTGRGRRRRRDRTTVGDQIGEGGRRMGQRDEDDGFDDATAGTSGAADELPMYTMDTSLPAYGSVAAEQEQRELQTALDASTTATAQPGTQTATSRLNETDGDGAIASGDEQLPSVQEYERLTRQARDNAALPGAPPPLAVRSTSSRSNAAPGSVARAADHRYPPVPSALDRTDSSARPEQVQRTLSSTGTADTGEEAGDQRSTMTTSASSGHTKVEDGVADKAAAAASTSQSRLDKHGVEENETVDEDAEAGTEMVELNRTSAPPRSHDDEDEARRQQ